MANLAYPMHKSHHETAIFKHNKKTHTVSVENPCIPHMYLVPDADTAAFLGPQQVPIINMTTDIDSLYLMNSSSLLDLIIYMVTISQ